MMYEQEMRSKLLEFIGVRIKAEREDQLKRNKEKVVEVRLNKLKQDAQTKLALIEGFKKTLDDMEWSDKFKEEEKMKSFSLINYNNYSLNLQHWAMLAYHSVALRNGLNILH